jgi:hypothetical protein
MAKEFMQEFTEELLSGFSADQNQNQKKKSKDINKKKVCPPKKIIFLLITHTWTFLSCLG